MQQAYFLHKLYPLQDEVLKLATHVKTKFYLTGGTALSRAWLNHRYSDDLDFFLNNDAEFNTEVEKLYQCLKASFNENLINLIDSAHFHRWVIKNNDITLKIEMINDVGFRKGTPVSTTLFYQTDTWENIASNKISALNRNEPKDIADLIFIENAYQPHWPSIIEDAKAKDLSVNEIEAAAYIGNFNFELLNTVRWIKNPEITECKTTAEHIAKKILMG